MNFFRNIIFIIFFSFISIFIVTSIIFYLFPINIYLKDSLENYVKDKSNYNLEINDLQFSLTNGILLNDISIANNDDIVFNSDNIILSINYYSLIYKKLNFKNIYVSNANLDLDNLSVNNNSNNKIYSIDNIDIDIDNLDLIYKTNLYSISSDLTINNRHENILVNINNLHLDNKNWKDNSISINKSHLIIKDDSINFDINSILETNVAILAKGNLLFENNQINFLNSKLEVKDSLHNLLMLDDIQAYIDLNQNQLKVDANSNLKSNLLKGDLNFEMNFKNNNINFNADLLEGPNNLIFNGNYNLSSNIWIVKTSIDNYLINYDEFEPSISGVIDFYGKKLDLINTEINISLIENNNNIMIDNVYGKINYKDSLFFSIGDIVFRNDDFVVLMSDLNVSKNDLVFNSIVDFSNYKFNNTFVNGKASFKVQKYNGEYEFSGNAELIDVTNESTSIDSIYIIYNGEYLDDIIDYNLETKAYNFKNNVFVFDTLKFDLKKIHDSFQINKLHAVSNQIDSLVVTNFSYKKNKLISFEKIRGNVGGPQIYMDSISLNSINNEFSFNKTKLNINDGYILLDGHFTNKEMYEVDIVMSDLNVEDLFKIINNEERYFGNINANINISNNNSNYIINTKSIVSDGKIDNIDYEKIHADFSFRNKRFLINNIEMKSNDGNFKFEGWLTSSNLFKQEGNIFSKNDSIFLVYEFDNLDLNKLNMYLPISNQISGLLVSEGKINGKMSDIVFYMDTNIENPGFDKLSGENLNGSFIYRDSQLYLKGFNFSNPEETYTVSGSLPYDIGIVKSNVNLNTLPLNIMITGKSNQFNILTNNIDNVDYLKGDISLQLSIAGNYNNPRRNGQLVIRNGELSLINLDNFVENNNGVAILRNNQLVFEDFKGYTRSYNFNKSILEKTTLFFRNLFSKSIQSDELSEINLYGSIDLSSFFQPNYSLIIKSDNIFIKDTEENFIGNGEANFSITGKDTVDVEGKFIPKPNMFKIISDFSSSSNDGMEDNKAPFYRYNIEVPLQNAIKVENTLMDLYLDGFVNISEFKNEGFKYSGELNIIEGSFFYNGNEFVNLNGNIYLDPTEFNPELDIFGSTNIAGENIDVSFMGSLNNPNLTLESYNNYSQSDIIELLLFRDNPSDNMSSNEQIENFISNYFENELERNISKYTFLNKFQFNTTGSLLSGIEDRNLDLYVGANLSPKLFVNYKRDVFSSVNDSEYELGYRMNRNMSVVAKIDENRLMNLNYRIRYHYK